MSLAFTPTAVICGPQSIQPFPSRRKPRAPPTFAQHRTTSRPWRLKDDDPALTAVATALEQWRKRTSHPPGHLPSDSQVRRCDAARDLRLHSLIVRAGGYKTVQNQLGLLPSVSSNRKELETVAGLLRELCEKEGRELNANSFPEMREIRRMDPRLGNRIAALPGRNGWRKLKECFGIESKINVQPKREWRVWTDPERIRAELMAYQSHPQVLPRLCALPSELGAAIQRQGGANVFVKKHAMVLEKDWVNLKRFGKLVNWLADEVGDAYNPDDTVEAYLELVTAQCQHAPPFPTMERVLEAGLIPDLQRYGGRKGLACRLGFERASGFKHVFMGKFSVRLAADLLQYAVVEVDVSEDCSVAMPTLCNLKANGMQHLADAVELLGGEFEVGRRTGLVPKL